MRSPRTENRAILAGFAVPEAGPSVRAQFLVSLSPVVVVALALFGTSIVLTDRGSVSSSFRYSEGNSNIAEQTMQDRHS